MSITKMNEYTDQWISLFLFRINSQQTKREVAFLRRVLPLPVYRRVIDVCCGSGRHCHLLAQDGYSTVGIDTNDLALSTARESATSEELYLLHDMRDLQQLHPDFDAAICLWQSFGFFDSVTNRAILKDLAKNLPVKGRCVFDIYHPEFFHSNQGERTYKIDERQITEKKVIKNGRLHVTLYGEENGAIGSFDWELFNPASFINLASDCGLECLKCCTEYDENKEPKGDVPRVQYVFEKTD